MKQILLFFVLGFFSLSSFSQACPKITSADIITLGPGRYQLQIQYTASGQKHIVDSLFCGNDFISTTCIDVKGDGTYSEEFTCAGIPKVVLVPGTGTCINGTTCGDKITVCPSCGPMPVTLSSFSAFKKDANILLTWQTQTEVNSSHFNILRSFDNVNFDIIGTVDNISAYSSVTHNYSFVDYKNTGNAITYYKLKIVDKDGKFTYSETKVVRENSSAKISFDIYPNPASGNSKIIFSGINGPTQVKFMDNIGRVIRTIDITSSGAVELSGLQRGNYFLVITEKKTGNSEVKKLTVVN